MDLENMDKATVLRMVSEGWQALENVLAQFSDAQMVLPNPPDGWNVQDMMVHISYWETFAWTRLQAARRGEKPVFDVVLNDDNLAKINQEVLEVGRARSLGDVKAELQPVHQRLCAELEQLPDSRDGPWWKLWPTPERPLRMIIGTTSNHYAEHLIDLKKWLESA